jgi:hypothetical protein
MTETDEPQQVTDDEPQQGNTLTEAPDQPGAVPQAVTPDPGNVTKTGLPGTPVAVLASKKVSEALWVALGWTATTNAATVGFSSGATPTWVDVANPALTPAGAAEIRDLPGVKALWNTEGWTETVTSTGATAGTPGSWTPAGSQPPPDAAGATTKGITASPATAWTTGQYVQGSTAGTPGQMHWSGTAWVAGAAP